MKKALLLIIPLLVSACTKTQDNSSSEQISSEQITSKEQASSSEQVSSQISSVESSQEISSEETNSTDVVSTSSTEESTSIITSSEEIVSSTEPVHEHDYELVISKYSEWHTFIAGQDFDETGLEVSLKCKTCQEKTNKIFLSNKNTFLNRDYCAYKSSVIKFS